MDRFLVESLATNDPLLVLPAPSQTAVLDISKHPYDIVSMTLRISSNELPQLTAKNLEKISFIKPTDPDNWTDEHYAILKHVVDRRGRDYELDAAALADKLRDITPETTSSGIGRPLTPRAAAHVAKIDQENLDDLDWLLERGGRPAFPPELSWSLESERGEYTDIIKAWGGATYRRQRIDWFHFQRFQRSNRKPAERFHQYQGEAQAYWLKEGIEGKLSLLADVKQQSQLGTWREYYYYHHLKLAEYTDKSERSFQKREKQKKEWETAHGTKEITMNPNNVIDVLWMIPNKPERQLTELKVLLNWIEQQWAIIAQEEEGSHGEADTTHASSLRPSKSGPKQQEISSTPVTATEKPTRILESARKLNTPTLYNTTPNEPVPTKLQPRRSTRVSGAKNQNRVPKTQAVAVAIRIRRSQRIIDLANKKQTPLEALRVKEPTKPKLQRQKSRQSERKPEPKTKSKSKSKPQGEAKSRVSKKKKGSARSNGTGHRGEGRAKKAS
ncbi:hypothetical protein FQN57_006352 [Myotisia sp. PD_48]|nr:hypothetical protein FQN57_006352 [Myotisia sp. PD_48]